MTFFFNAIGAIVAWLSSIKNVLSITGITGFFGALSAAASALFVKFVVAGSGFRLLRIAGLASGITAFYLGLEHCIGMIEIVVPEPVIVASSWVLPSNTTMVLSCLLTAYGARMLFDARTAILKAT